MITDDHRRFHRANLNTQITLTFQDRPHATNILDCSIKGARVERQPDWDIPMGTKVELIWPLDPQQGQAIQMQTEVAWLSDTSLGLRCLHIDIDSISHLRRLLELNLGDADLLERDLEHLLQEP